MSNFLGSSYFVRGHRQDLRFCRPDATRVCGDDLLGSRLLVGNVELRVPLFGILSREIDYGMFPADAFVFADGGRIWGDGSTSVISSIGGGVRVNAMGFPGSSPPSAPSTVPGRASSSIWASASASERHCHRDTENTFSNASAAERHWS